MMSPLSRHTINRLSYYRKLLLKYEYLQDPHIYSHDLADLAGVNPVQVRSDLRSIGLSGNHRKGYPVRELILRIETTLANGGQVDAILVGVGRLGKAILGYVHDYPGNFDLKAAFDIDPGIIGHRHAGVMCYHTTRLTNMIQVHRPLVAILAVPGDSVQEIASLVTRAGVTGILNFTAERVECAEGVFVKNCDVISLIEETGYFSGLGQGF